MARHPVRLVNPDFFPAPKDISKAGGRRVNDATWLQVLSFVEKCVVENYSNKQIQRLCKQEFGIGHTAVDTAINEIAERWQKEEVVRRPMWKASAMQRITEHIRTCREQGKWQTVATFENLLADMQGTKEPIQLNLNVQVTSAIAAIVMDMDADGLERILSEQRDLLELRDARDEFMTGSPRVINTTGVPVKR